MQKNVVSIYDLHLIYITVIYPKGEKFLKYFRMYLHFKVFVSYLRTVLVVESLTFLCDLRFLSLFVYNHMFRFYDYLCLMVLHILTIPG